MWTLKRRQRTDSTGAAAVAEPPPTGFEGTDEQLREQIARLSELTRQRPSRDTQQELLRLRNQLGIRLMEGEAPEPRFPDPDFERVRGGDALPEFSGGEVTGGLLRAGILTQGCLLVRGLVPRERAERFAAEIDRLFTERDRHDDGGGHDPGYYSEFVPDPRYGVIFGRPWIKEGGGVLAVDSPQLSFEMLEMFEQNGLPRLVTEYLGEPPILSGQKTTLRKATPDVPGAWHQDGKFMGPVRALNLWLSLSRCGDESPGLDIVPKRLDEFVATETDDAMIPNQISGRQAELAAGDAGVLRPIFEPGDALFFDEMFLHQTGSDPSMPKPRFAIESWFFGGSAFPQDYAPVAV